MTIKLQKLIITRLLQLVFKGESLTFVVDFIDFFQQLRKKSGLAYAIKYFKAVKLHCTRYICGNPLRVNNEIRIKLQNGFPTRFSYLKELIDKGHFRIVLTILT
jgi:hypothetical protein